jgi:hypothetical protein
VFLLSLGLLGRCSSLIEMLLLEKMRSFTEPAGLVRPNETLGMIWAHLEVPLFKA